MSKSNSILRNVQLREAHTQAVAAAAAAAAAESRGRSDAVAYFASASRGQQQNHRGPRDHKPVQMREPAPTPKSNVRIVYQQFSHSRRKAVQVVTRDASLAPTVYSCKFVAARNGGVIATIKDPQGRVIFPDNRGPQPKDDGRNYSFHLVGPNAKGNVNFASVLIGAPQIKVLPSGKIECTNRRAPKIAATGKSIKPLPKNRQGRVNDVFVPEEDDYDPYVTQPCEYCGYEGCEVCTDLDEAEFELSDGQHDDDNDAESVFWQTVDGIERSLDGHSHDRPSITDMDGNYHGGNEYGMPTHTNVLA